MTFQFEKVYADCVTPDGTVVVAYLTWLSVAGWRFPSAGIELYPSGGPPRVLHAVRVEPAGVPTFSDARWELALSGEGYHVTMTFVRAFCGWRPPGAIPHAHLRWHVITPRADVSVVMREPGGVTRLEGLGYVDCVELRRPLRALGLCRLKWGRAHPAGSALAFTDLTFRDGRTWRRAAFWADGAAVEEGTPPEFSAGDVPLVMGCGGRSWPVETSRTIHDGDALHSMRFPHFATRTLVRAISGRVTETRRVGRLGAHAQECQALYEDVSFR